MITAPALSYRPDIDGLRALAVIPVVLFHAGVSAMSGGFVGVDVFFVISGFLITSILLKDLAENTFSIVDFYKRRIKRIIPAFLLVIFVTLSIGFILFPPDRLEELARASTSSILFSSNFFFWKSVDYFQTKTHVEPLLHTWSLAVEEQFYIFFPWLVFLAVRFRFPLTAIMGAVLVGSFVLSAVVLEVAPSAAFYLLPARAWELAIGGLLALGWIAPPSSRRLSNLAGIGGLALIIVAIAAYDNSTPFPGFAAIMPTFGAALIIWSGKDCHSIMARFLAAPLLVLIGRASYSFYLWHLPLFAFATYTCGGILPLWIGLSLSVIALLLALATLRFIEDPIRRSAGRSIYLILTALMLGLLALSLGILRFDGIPQRFSQSVLTVLATADDKNRHPSECMSSGNSIRPPEKPCLLGNTDVAPSVLLWGDSHAMVNATAMETAALRAHRSFWFVAAADCPPGLNFSISEQFATGLTRSPAYRFCDDYNRRMLKLALTHPGIKTVVISSRWSNWRLGQPANPAESSPDIRLQNNDSVASSPAENANIFRRGFLSLVTKLTSVGKVVYIVGPIPEPAFDVPQRLYISRFGAVEEPIPITREKFNSRHNSALNLIAEAAKQEDVKIIRPEAALCDERSCPIKRGGNPIYFDHNHLSIYGARLTASLYTPVFR